MKAYRPFREVSHKHTSYDGSGDIFIHVVPDFDGGSQSGTGGNLAFRLLFPCLDFRNAATSGGNIFLCRLCWVRNVEASMKVVSMICEGKTVYIGFFEECCHLKFND